MKEIKQFIKETMKYGLPIVTLWKRRFVTVSLKLAFTPFALLLTLVTFPLALVYILGYLIVFIPIVWSLWAIDKKVRRFKKRKSLSSFIKKNDKYTF